MENMIIVAILVIILGAASWYMYEAKKSGKSASAVLMAAPARALK